MLHIGSLLDSLVTAEDRNLIDQARAFGEKHFTEKNIRAWISEGGIPEYVMREFKESELGYTGLSTMRGGKKISFFTQILVLEELSRTSGTMLPIQSQITTFNTLSQIASPAQIDFIMDKYEETARPCFSYAITDANSGSNMKHYSTHIEERGGKFILNGSKSFVNNGMYAPYLLVLAKNASHADDPKNAPFCLWLIPKDAPGITIYPIRKIGQQILPAAAVEFADVEIDPEWQIGNRNFNPQQLNYLLNAVRCTACANSLGMAQAALEDAAFFAGKHEVGGKPLVENQQIDLKLADMQADVWTMRYLTYNAAHSIEAQLPDIDLATAVMKKYVPARAVEVADKGMQILGGIGYTDSTRMSRIWIDCRGNQFATGTDEVMTVITAREVMKLYS